MADDSHATPQTRIGGRQLHETLSPPARAIFDHLQKQFGISTTPVTDDQTGQERLPSKEYFLAEKVARLAYRQASTRPNYTPDATTAIMDIAVDAYQLGLATFEKIGRTEPALADYIGARLDGDNAMRAFEAKTFTGFDETSPKATGAELVQAMQNHGKKPPESHIQAQEERPSLKVHL